MLRLPFTYYLWEHYQMATLRWKCEKWFICLNSTDGLGDRSTVKMKHLIIWSGKWESFVTGSLVQ